MTEERPYIGGRYKHRKSGVVYTVRLLARREHDGVLMVAYEGPDGTVWARPMSEWFETVSIDEQLGPRFEFVGPIERRRERRS